MRWAIVVLAVSQLGLSVALWSRTEKNHTVYVLMPMVDVVPGGNPLDRTGAEALVADVRRQADARDMQTAYAWLGSTLSLDDLLRGVEGLTLSAEQSARIAAILDAARSDHARIREVQGQVLAEEANIRRAIDALARGMPAPTATELQALLAGPQ